MSSPIDAIETLPGSDLSRTRRARTRSGTSTVLRYAVMVAGLSLIGGFAWQLGLFESVQKVARPLAPVVNPRLSQAFAPNFSGRDKNNRPYSIDADIGFLDEKTDNIVHMKNMRGVFERPSGAAVNITSATAAYNKHTKKMDVEGDVRMSDGAKFTAKMKAATLNTENHSMQSRSDVDVQLGSGSATAASMSVTEDGARITLKGGVKARFMTKSEPTEGTTP